MRIIPILLALGLAVGGAVAPAAAAPIGDGSLSIIASPAFSGTLGPDQPLLISGTITNRAGQPRTAGTATVFLGTSRLATSAALSGWMSSDDSVSDTPGAAVAEVIVGEVAAGQIFSFSVTIPASAIHLPRGNSGVYPLTVQLTADGVGFGLARSTVVWTSGNAGQKVNLSVVSPIVTPRSPDGLLSAADLETLTAPGGHLDSQLTNAQIHTLTLGVDPRIIASIRILGVSAPADAQDWLSRLDATRTDVFLLAYADADLALERKAGAKSPLTPTSFPIDESLFPEEPEDTPTPSESPTPAGESPVPTPESLDSLAGSISSLTWPTESGVTKEDLDFLSEGGYTRTLATSSDITHPTGMSPNVTVGKHRLTVSDSAISELLRKAANADTNADWAHAMAALTSILSITATEHPGATVVATLGRDGYVPGASLNKTLTSLTSLSWIQPTTLRAAMMIPPTPAKLAKVEHDSDRTSTVSALFAAEKSTDRFASVVDDPSLVTGPQRLGLLALLSTAWQSDPLAWSAATETYLSESADLRSSVHLPASSQITLLQEKGNLPITVRNELDFPVTVYVTVKPDRPILNVLNNHVELKIEANSQTKALVPVQSVANGEVRTVVTLSSASGVPISTPTAVVLNVQAGWETAATVVLAILVIVLFGAGIGRTIWRRSTARVRRLEDARLQDAHLQDAPVEDGGSVS